MKVENSYWLWRFGGMTLDAGCTEQDMARVLSDCCSAASGTALSRGGTVFVLEWYASIVLTVGLKPTATGHYDIGSFLFHMFCRAAAVAVQLEPSTPISLVA